MNICSCRTKLKKSNPNAENVVNPPQNPTIQKERKSSDAGLVSRIRIKYPIRNPPDILTTKVTQGTELLKKEYSRKRIVEPIPPPSPASKINLKLIRD